MSRIVLATIGSLGDIHPMIAIGLALKGRGHEVVFATSAHYHGRLQKLGFIVTGLRPDSISPTDDDLLARVMDMQEGSGFLIRDYIFPSINEMYEDLNALCAGADAVIVTELVYAGRLVAEVNNIPWAFLALAPSSFFSVYDMPVLPGKEAFAVLHKLGPNFNKFLIQIGQWVGSSWPKPYYKLRQSLGLPPQGNPIFNEKFSPHLVLAAFSSVLGKAQKDWPSSAVITGFAYHDSTPDLFDQGKAINAERLRAFLAEDDAPIIFTLGSAAIFVAGDFYEQSIEAVKILGRRAIFLTGQNKLGENLPPGMIAFDYLPFHEAFPHAAAIVHQGGVGTSAQALRAGKPTLCVPFSHDQPDNARRLQELGTSLTLARKHYKAKRVAAKLDSVLRNQNMALKATEVAQILQGEDGAQRSADAIESIIRKF
ncbi:MAG: glycosyltransferase [Cyanobacteria bacterium SZAS LIN-3]|nr:glycosyltransferase [Cyanobacteria bacterium SZAS LIN-3]